MLRYDVKQSLVSVKYLGKCIVYDSVYNISSVPIWWKDADLTPM